MFLFKCMKVNNLDKFLNSSMLSSSIFVASGAYKTYQDYKYADKKYKDKFLIKDAVVLSGAALGMLAFHTTSPKISQKLGLRSKYPEYIRDFTSSFLNFTSGILGAMGIDYLLSKTGFEQPEINKENIRQNKLETYIDHNFDKITDEKTKKAVYSRITDMPQMQVLSSGLIGAYALDLAKDKELETRLKHTTKCLINNSLIPLLLLTVSSTLTKTMKPFYRLPIIFASLVGGTVAINKFTEKKITQKVKEEITKIKLKNLQMLNNKLNLIRINKSFDSIMKNKKD